ncbi:MAG TPA: folate-binding protein [Mycobacteriales bacterium]|nr:folate-binding protein [Mycobacteriales bacterium]
MDSPLLRRPGAVAADPPDVGVAAHYGDPYREQRELAAGSALVDLSHRPVLRIAGPDRLSWLHSLTTQHLEHVAPGVTVDALVLSPQGHVEHHLRLRDNGEAVLAVVEPGTAAALLAFLDRMRFLLRVEVSEATDQLAMTSGGLIPRADLAGYDGPLAGVLAAEALRIAAREPRLGRDTDHRSLPNESTWLRTAVHLDKGCYRGQETVARVWNLGRPPRRTVLLHLDGSGSDLPATGDPVLLGDREVGRVGSVARHYELGPIALGLVRRAVPDDAELLAGGVPARIDPVPDDLPESPARGAAAARSGLLRPPRP